MSEKPRKTGNLREVLLDALHDVRHGHLEQEKAICMAKLAAQVSVSMIAEIRVNEYLEEIGDEVKRFGALDLIAPKTSSLPRARVDQAAIGAIAELV